MRKHVVKKSRKAKRRTKDAETMRLKQIIAALEADKKRYQHANETQARVLDSYASRNVQLLDMCRQFAELKTVVRAWLKE